jgi:hypothetical protein
MTPHGDCSKGKQRVLVGEKPTAEKLDKITRISSRLFSYAGESFLLLPLTIFLTWILIVPTGCNDNSSTPPPETLSCSLTYTLPGDVDKSPTEASQDDFDKFSWQSFLALSAPSVGGRINVDGDNTPQWRQWSSTADLLNQADPGPSGSRYYPEVCMAIPDYENYRVIDQVGKVNDNFQEATEDALSTSPVIDKNGNFLRYEILISPSMYNRVVSSGWNVPGTIPVDPQADPVPSDITGTCGLASYTGGDPADNDIGFIQIKNAWMDLNEASPSERAKYHVEELLVYTPAYRTSTNPQVATCELRTMGLVGQHIMHKTLTQPAWVYSTFEHVDNAPDCLGPSTTGGSQAGTPSDACPPIVQKDWNFNPMICNDDADSSRIDGCPPDPDTPVTNRCAHCNDTPSSNDITAMCMAAGTEWIGTCCSRPDGATTPPPGACNPGMEPWCLDRGLAEVKGYSRLCRQIAVSEDEAKGGYISAARWNGACHLAITVAGSDNSVWSNYELISTQWMIIDFAEDPNARECINVSRDVIQYKDGSAYVALKPDIEPKPASEGGTQPVLGNTSMESYQRANCLGCHAKSTTGSGDVDTIFKDHASTDFMYWLKLEVPQSAATES